MNIFKRELLTNIRNPIFIFLPGFGVLFSAIGIDLEFFDIKSLYSIYPYFFTIITPLLASGIWLRDKKLGLSSILKLSQFPLKKIIGSKIAAHLTLNGVFLLSFLIIPIISYSFTSIDPGQLLTINFGILIYIYFLICISIFVSTIINSRIFVTVVTSGLGVLIWNTSSLYTTFFDGYFSVSTYFLYFGLSLLLFYVSVSILDKKFKIIDIITTFFIFFISFTINTGFDFTKSGSYRLADYSKNLVENSNINIEFYYTGLTREGREVVDKSIILLKRFDKLKGVNVTMVPSGTVDFERALSVYDMNKNLQENNFIVVKYNQHYHVIPSIPNYAFLEFEIGKVVNYLKNEGLPRVGIYLGNETLSQDGFNVLNSNLSEDFNTEFLYPGDIIPSDMEALILLGSMDINDYYAHEIGHYIAEGGNVIFAVNGLDISNNLTTKDNSILNSLRALGVYPEPYLVADSNNIESFQLNVIANPNRDSGLPSLVAPYTGFTGFYISPIAIKNSSFSPVISSSVLSWLVDSSTGIDGLPETSFTLAAYGEGVFGDFFDSHSHEKSHNRFLIIGSNLSFTDYPNTLNLNGNYDFIKRGLYKVLGMEELIKIRNRNIIENSYFKLENNLYSNSILSIFKIFALVIYPILLTIISFVIYKKS